MTSRAPATARAGAEIPPSASQWDGWAPVPIPFKDRPSSRGSFVRPRDLERASLVGLEGAPQRHPVPVVEKRGEVVLDGREARCVHPGRGGRSGPPRVRSPGDAEIEHESTDGVGARHGDVERQPPSHRVAHDIGRCAHVLEDTSGGSVHRVGVFLEGGGCSVPRDVGRVDLGVRAEPVGLEDGVPVGAPAHEAVEQDERSAHRGRTLPQFA